MELKLFGGDKGQPHFDIKISATTHDTYAGSLILFLEAIERLRTWHANNDGDTVRVHLDLSKSRVCFSSEVHEDVTLSLWEWAMIPSPVLRDLESIERVSSMKKQMFPDGVTLTVEDLEKRFPWVPDHYLLVFADSKEYEVSYFEHTVKSAESISGAIDHFTLRHGRTDCYIVNGDGALLACMSRDTRYMTDCATQLYGSESSASWLALKRDVRFLLLPLSGNPRRLLIYELKLSEID